MKKCKILFMLTLMLTNVIGISAQDYSFDSASSEESLDIVNESVNYILRDYYISVDKAEQKRSDSKSNINLASAYVTSQAWTNSGITKYFQDDSRWGSKTMQTCGKTIAAAGCALTTFTMITTKHGYSNNPGDVNTKLGEFSMSFSILCGC